MSFAFGGGAAGGGGFGGAAAGGPGAFGTTSAFGAASKPATPGFGGFGGGATTGGFGAAPAAGGTGLFGGGAGAAGGTTAFGGGGASPTTGFGAAPAAGGFGSGGFGAGATTSAFGAKPAATGAASSPFGQSSLFGGASTTQSTFGAPASSGFGATATSGGFGTPAPAASSGGLFGGGGGGAFGAKPAATGPFGGGASTFGGGGAATTGAFGGGGAATGAFGSAAAPAQPQVGTGNPPYQPHGDTDAGGAVQYLSISRMQAYAHKSAEELRFEDYLKRTNPAAAAQQAAMYPAPAAAPAAGGSAGAAGGFGGGFGGFGASGATGTQGAFGSGNAFGSTPAAGTSGFGGFTTGGGSTPGGGGLFGSATRSAGGFGAASQPMGAASAFGGGGFGATTTAATGFGGAAATPAPAFGAGGFGQQQQQQQPQTGGFGGFGSTATTGGFGGAAAGGFGKPAAPAAGGFGFGAANNTATPAAGGGFGGFGAGAQTSVTGGTSLFGGGAAAGGSSFGFGGAAKPPASGGFGGFGASAPGTATTATGGFGTGGGFGAAAPAAGGLFGGAGAAAPQTGGGLFGGAAAAAPATSTGGFGFGGGATTLGSAAPATAGGGMMFNGAAGGFGAAKPAGTSLFGGTSGASTGTTSLFGSLGSTGAATSAAGTGTSLFGGTSTATKSLGFGSGGFGFGGGATGSTGFGAATTTAPKTTGFGGFGSFGAATSTAPSTGFSFGGGATSSFAPTTLGGAAPATAAAGAAPANASLVAAPDVNPYGAGSFGAGLVEQNVKAALDLPSLKTSSSSSAARLSSFAQDVGLPRGAMESSVTTRRHLLSNRYSIPVSFIRGSSFKGSKNRLASITSAKTSSSQLGGSNAGVRFGSAPSQTTGGSADDEFKFSSTLFRNSVAKRLVIDKSDSSAASSSARSRVLPSRAAVVPLSDDDAARDSSNGVASGSQRPTRPLLKPEAEDGLYRVVFRNMATNKSFTLRLKGNERVQDAREEVKRLIDATTEKEDGSKGMRDVELLVHGRIVADTLTVEALRLREDDSVDVAIVEDLTGGDSGAKSTDATAAKSAHQATAPTAPSGRFVSYAEFMSSAMRETEAEATSAHAKPVSAACPSLKNEDYFTVPSYDRLKRMTEQELAQVEGFKVGCKGLGTVEWLGKTDVRNLDLDDLIQFEKKEVIVYKDDENKHPHGTGLNRPAIVELLGVFPPRKTQDPEQYRERVQQRTVDIGATFIDYSPSKGIWRFRVEHFSRYGFDDEDDDDDDEVEGDVDMETAEQKHSKAVAAMATQKKKMVMAPSASKHSKRIAVDDPRVGLLRNSMMYGDRSTSHNVSVASFRADGTVLAPSPATDEKDDDKMVDDDVADEEESEPTAIVKMERSVVFPVNASSATVPILPLGIDCESSRLPRDAKSTTYQIYLQATQQAAVKSQVDLGLFMARSFRCSWGPNGELVNIGKLVTSRQTTKPLGRRVAIEMPLEVEGSQRKSLTTELLDLHFKCCESSPFEGDCTDAAPLYALPSTNDGVVHCLHEYVAFSERVRKQHPSSRRFRRWALLWKLVHALWGQEHDQLSGGQSQRACPLAARDDPREIESMESLPMVDLRREAISRWFEDALSAEWAAMAPEQADAPSQAQVLKLLCQHRIVEAAEAAMACGDFRLSTMIAQTATYEGSDFRTLIADQLAQWTENGTLEFIEEDVVMIYSLLAGSVEVVTAQRANDLTWLMCLALFFWYKRGPAVSLKVALGLYREAVDKQLARAPVAKAASTTPQKLDMLMEVMKLYVDDAVSLCSVLSPSGLKGDDWNGDTRDLHLDYELSWHLHSVLRAVGYKIDRKWESHVHQNFLRQLDGAGQWKEAVYVSLNISDATERAASCRELLVRNTDLLSAAKEARSVLAERYLVPQPWIEEALAVGAVNQHEYRKEIAHWIAAQRFEEAHACLVRHVAPSCLFSGERAVLLQLLEELELFADQISQWTASCIDALGLIGGGLWLEYLRLEQQTGLQVGREAEFLARLMHLAERLTSAAPSTPSTTAALATTDREQIVARTALSSMLVTLSTQTIKIRSLLGASKQPLAVGDRDELPAHLEPSFLSSLAQLTRGRETKFVESYRALHVHALCSAFVDWRA
ncbi:hypothetical protein P43SY_005665 [Pythium insidiosum]|uniref:Peptidase S59 domain-containing protein n=1 Tax=Pythium insidiosum TaxID=114742 RepID=A0AAD5Q3Y4_PYTIN|nr:hypothetical protein P43SY_005665 [Pythium insidiosum]